MSKQKSIRLIIRDLMDRPEYKELSYKEIMEAAYFAQFGFVHNMISSGVKGENDSFKNIAIKYFGSFIAHPRKVEITSQLMKEAKNEKHS